MAAADKPESKSPQGSQGSIFGASSPPIIFGGGGGGGDSGGGGFAGVSGSGGGGFAFGAADAASAGSLFSVPPAFGAASAGTGAGAEGGDDNNADAAGGDPEAECQAQFKPVVELEEVAVTTGEEHEECLFEMKSKLYRFEPESNEWKERGIGPVKFLKHKETGQVRLLHRNDKVLKIRANHIVMPGTNLTEHAGTENSWVWSTWDFADEEQRYEMFAIKFGNEERAQQFHSKHAEAMNINASLGVGDETEETEEEAAKKEEKAKDDAAADELASKLESTEVKEEEKKEEEEEETS